MRLYSRAQSEDPVLQESLLAIAHGMSEMTLGKLLGEIVQHKSRFQSLFSTMDAMRTAQRRLHDTLGIAEGTTLETLLARHFTYSDTELATLRQITNLLLSGTATDQKTGAGLATWLENAGNHTASSSAQLHAYIKLFLTDEMEARKQRSMFGKATLDDAQAEAVFAEQARVLAFHEAWKSLKILRSTTDMLLVAQALLVLYEHLKRQQGQMDYDDLILTARNLLQKPDIAAWVLFKLDGGIDHVLIDEAQDTSPVQWEIVTAITQEFFVGLGRSENERSLFVVGDEKQSIYSFQGADPAALGRMQTYFSRQINDAGKSVQSLALLRSFRSTREVLAVVDSVFAAPAARQGLTFGDGTLEHIATRTQHPGTVELWPLITPPERSGDEVQERTQPPVSLLASRIADTIQDWLARGMQLPAKGRTVHAGDIMVLVRTRTVFVDRLVRALKRRGVPVAGHDRMELGENLVVEDMVALGQCLLLPEDDLTLASLLKSPFFNVSEEELYQLAQGRGKATLWQRLREHENGQGALARAYAMLAALRSKADFFSPYELYSYVLDTLGARGRIIGRMGDEYNDPMDEFLGQALLYERSHTPSLQGFIHWLGASRSEIKRDMEQSRGAVRIMTVHGAKGLQAPIVILPDTASVPTSKDVLLWLEEAHKAPLPLWPRSRSNEEKTCSTLRSDKYQAELCEYRRQLYVALTRAEDMLFICGATSQKQAHASSWYQHVRDAMEKDGTSFDYANQQQGFRIGAEPAFSGKAATSAADTAQDKTSDNEWAFLAANAPSEPSPSFPLTPSRLTAEEPAAASPLAGAGTLYQRGTLIHRLLQYLPGMAAERRAQAASQIAHLYRNSLDDSVRTACINEAMHIIEHPPYDFLFGKDALAEAPVAGCIQVGSKQVAVAGQIDRLYIGATDVWVVDFKTGRNAPSNSREVPLAYLQQMRLYQQLMASLYPEKHIHCGILWTAAPALHVLDEALLDEVDLSTYI
jgi:ATP-dependent helicase/nuclease subunit A